MKAVFIILFLALGFIVSDAQEQLTSREMMHEEQTPRYLYKVLSVDGWQKSQSQETLVLSTDDSFYIHLSREDQLERILSKYWAESPEYVILKLDVAQLQGKLVYEANPGGENKYYHLYDGAIPLKAVVEVKLIKQKVGKGV